MPSKKPRPNPAVSARAQNTLAVPSQGRAAERLEAGFRAQVVNAPAPSSTFYANRFVGAAGRSVVSLGFVQASGAARSSGPCLTVEMPRQALIPLEQSFSPAFRSALGKIEGMFGANREATRFVGKQASVGVLLAHIANFKVTPNWSAIDYFAFLPGEKEGQVVFAPQVRIITTIDVVAEVVRFVEHQRRRVPAFALPDLLKK